MNWLAIMPVWPVLAFCGIVSGIVGAGIWMAFRK